MMCNMNKQIGEQMSYFKRKPIQSRLGESTNSPEISVVKSFRSPYVPSQGAVIQNLARHEEILDIA